MKRWVPLDEAVDAVLEGRLQNSILIVAVLRGSMPRRAGHAGPADAPWLARRCASSMRARRRSARATRSGTCATSRSSAGCRRTRSPRTDGISRGISTFLAERGIDGRGRPQRRPTSPAFARGLRERPQSARRLVGRAHALSSVRGFHRFLLDEGLVEVGSPRVEVSPPKLPMRLPKAITIEQMDVAARGDRRRRARPRARQGPARAALRDRRAGLGGGRPQRRRPDRR